MIRRYSEPDVVKSTLFLLALWLAPVAACTVKVHGLEQIGDDTARENDGSVRGRDGGSPPSSAGDGGDVGSATAADGAADAKQPRTDDARVDERVAPAGGADGNRTDGTSAGEDARRDLAFGTGDATGGDHGLDSGPSGAPEAGGQADERNAADERTDDEIERDNADAEGRDLGSDVDRVPDVPVLADGPEPDLSPLAADTRLSPDVATSEAAPSLSLVWSDEFEGSANTPVDVAKWNQVTWAPGTVNNEVQQYTAGVRNVFHDGNGCLVIRALHNSGANNAYTSGRIDTSGKVSFGPGHRVEVRAKLPAGAGSFPGIVMMGTGNASWPASGELALMEQYGQDKSWFYATVYAPSSAGSGATAKTRYDFSDALTASADFHVYSLDWYSDHLDIQVDGNVVLTSNYGSSSPFYSITEYIVLDVALGGDMGGAIDDSAFPMEMVVDYVRVYQF